MIDVKKSHKAVKTIAQEVHKTVSAPYAVLYKTLLHVLIDSDDDLIYAWIIAKQCQIRPLILRVIASLNHDKAAFQVLLRLIVHKEVRDEAITQDPSILCLIFSGIADENVFEACIRVCRHPFPENFALPIEYFDLVSAVLENTKQMSVQVWAYRVFVLLANAPAGTLATINESVLRECITMWSESGKSADNVTFISFMAISALVHDAAEYGELESTNMNESKKLGIFKVWKIKCSALFTTPKAHKIIKSLLLRTLYIVSEASSMQTQEILQCLDMVRHVFTTTPERVIQDALKDQEFMQILVKLAEKSGRCGTDVLVQSAISSVLLNVDPEHRFVQRTKVISLSGENIPYQFLFKGEANEGGLSQAVHDMRLYMEHARLWQATEQYCFSQKVTVQDFMDRAIKFCQPGVQSNIDNAIAIRLANQFIVTFHRMILNAELESSVSDTIVDLSLPEWWPWYIHSECHMQCQHCQHYEACPCVFAKQQCQLVNSIASVVVAASCTSEHRLDRRTYSLLERTMHRDRMARNGNEECYPHSISTIGNQRLQSMSDSFRHTEITSISNELELDDMLTTMNTHVSKSVSKYINNICYDLQLRCENVEAPLRAEQRRSEEFQKELAKVKQSTEIVIAEHQARRLSWQHSLQIEQEQVTLLQDQQVEFEQSLRIIQEQLASEIKQRLEIEHSSAELSRRYEETQKILEAEAADNQRCKDDCVALTARNEELQRQLREAQEKQQRLLAVLNGTIGDL